MSPHRTVTCRQALKLAAGAAAVLLGKIQGEALAYNLIGELAWALVLVVATRLLYRFGLRRYSAYGG